MKPTRIYAWREMTRFFFFTWFVSSTLFATIVLRKGIVDTTGNRLKPAVANCLNMKANIFTAIQNIQNCSFDADCIESPFIAQGASCALLINRNANLSGIYQLISTFQDTCRQDFRYTCARDEVPYTKSCQSGRCFAIYIPIPTISPWPKNTPHPTGLPPGTTEESDDPYRTYPARYQNPFQSNLSCLSDIDCSFGQVCYDGSCYVDNCRNCKIDEMCESNRCVQKK